MSNYEIVSVVGMVFAISTIAGFLIAQIFGYLDSMDDSDGD